MVKPQSVAIDELGQRSYAAQMPDMPEELDFIVEERFGGRVHEVIARSCNGLVARAAYRAARELRPKAHLMLRYRARVIVEDQPQGGLSAPASRP